MTKKVLVTEKLAQAGLDRLAEKGLQVDVKLKMSTDELIEAIPDYDALVVRSATHVTREVIAAASKLRIIGRAGVGVDNVDVEAATEAGIIVCNAPTSNIVSAAEQTMCLMLACARNTAQANACTGRVNRGPSHSGGKRVACVSSSDCALRYEGVLRMPFRVLLTQCSFAFRHANFSALHPALAPDAAKALPNARFGQDLTCG